MSTINDIDNLVELRTKLLNDVHDNTENYNWRKYSRILKTYYNDVLLDRTAIAFLSEKNGNIVAMSMMCFCNVVPSLFNLEGKLAFITDMYTLLEYRNKGLGMDLLNNIMEYAKTLGYKLANVEMLDENNKRIIVRSEEDIFRLINFPYATPIERNI